MKYKQELTWIGLLVLFFFGCGFYQSGCDPFLQQNCHQQYHETETTVIGHGVDRYYSYWQKNKLRGSTKKNLLTRSFYYKGFSEEKYPVPPSSMITSASPSDKEGFITCKSYYWHDYWFQGIALYFVQTSAPLHSTQRRFIPKNDPSSCYSSFEVFHSATIGLLLLLFSVYGGDIVINEVILSFQKLFANCLKEDSAVHSGRIQRTIPEISTFVELF